tara:strand:+ start:1250 stop:1447 length:198 start_codon:yes stop_codon:yes gene_type:complete
MNKLTAENNPFYVDELLSPMKQPMADVETLNTPEKTNALLGFLGQLTNYSYDSWLARGSMQDVMK